MRRDWVTARRIRSRKYWQEALLLNWTLTKSRMKQSWWRIRSWRTQRNLRSSIMTNWRRWRHMVAKTLKMTRNLQRLSETRWTEITNSSPTSSQHTATTRTARWVWGAQDVSETRPNNANMPTKIFSHDLSLKILAHHSKAHPLKHKSRQKLVLNSPDPTKATAVPMRTWIELIIVPLLHDREANSNHWVKGTHIKISKMERHSSWGILRTSMATSILINQNIPSWMFGTLIIIKA